MSHALFILAVIALCVVGLGLSTYLTAKRRWDEYEMVPPTPPRRDGTLVAVFCKGGADPIADVHRAVRDDGLAIVVTNGDTYSLTTTPEQGARK